VALFVRSEGKGRDEKTAWESFKGVSGAGFGGTAGRRGRRSPGGGGDEPAAPARVRAVSTQAGRPTGMKSPRVGGPERKRRQAAYWLGRGSGPREIPVSALSGLGAQRPHGLSGSSTPRLFLSPRPRPAGRGPYLQLREQDLPPLGVRRHCAPLWTPHLNAAAAGRREKAGRETDWG
jgi:hypothetical protein